MKNRETILRSFDTWLSLDVCGPMGEGTPKVEWSAVGRRVAREIADALGLEKPSINFLNAGDADAGEVLLQTAWFELRLPHGSRTAGTFLYRAIEGGEPGVANWAPYSQLVGAFEAMIEEISKVEGPARSRARMHSRHDKKLAKR